MTDLLTRPAMRRARHNLDRDSVSFKNRNAFNLLTMINGKTPKGEHAGYLTAILYLMPHTSGGGQTLCPYSTVNCRAMCLSDAGLGALPRAMGAKQQRTDLFQEDFRTFRRQLLADLERLAIRPAVRLNGTSDIVWERALDLESLAATHKVVFYDYTKVPLQHRGAAAHYHLTYSVGGPEDMPRAIDYLRHGGSVAVVVPLMVKYELAGLELDIGGSSATFIDGDDTDLRFLDAPGSIVLLKPKGYARSDLIRADVLNELRSAAWPTAS